jgi:uncharacterized protein (DUF2141 family)
MKQIKTILLILSLTLLCAACASIGRPEGGPRDQQPPEFVRSTPMPGTLNVNRNKLEIYFDENVQLDDAFNKVIVSPVQKQTPVIRANGHRVTVELRDTLVPNATYTIDFADAIKDLNEGNILDGFALDFATGDTIDTLRISGVVLEARTLEPAQGMTVGIYSNLADSAITKLSLERIARTNQYGQFTVRNLKPGKYNVYALNDVNRDHRWDRSEDVAFYGTPIEPWVETISVSDTLRADNGGDTIVTHPGTAYYPNDVLLTWFNEDFKSQYLKTQARPERRKITIEFAAPSDSFPELKLVDGPRAGSSLRDMTLLSASATRDTLTYWLTDPEVLATDSLRLSMRYLQTDTLSNLVWRTDTLKFYYHEPKQKKKDKKHEEADTVPPPIEFLKLQAATSAQHEIYNPVIIKTETPIAEFNRSGVHLELQTDTVWNVIPSNPIHRYVGDTLLMLSMDMTWQPGRKYRLTVDSTAVHDAYGLFNDKFVHEFTVKKPEDYSNLKFTISGPDTTDVVVELLDASDRPVRRVDRDRVSGEAKFTNVTPGTYYARLYIDSNSNGKWDTGNVAEHLQPEEVYYYNAKLELKANWDVEQTWNIYDVAIDMQKPWAIKKNKPKLKKGERAPGQPEDEEDEDDGWGTSTSGNRKNSNNNGFGGLGGIQKMNNLNSGTLRR